MTSHTFTVPLNIHSTFTFPAVSPLTQQIVHAGFLALFIEDSSCVLRLGINGQTHTDAKLDAQTLQDLAAFITKRVDLPKVEWKDD